MSCWQIEDVQKELERREDVKGSQVSFGLLDEGHSVGVGRAEGHWVVLMMPSRAGVMGYSGAKVKFEPRCSLVDRMSGRAFDPVALLKFYLDPKSPEARDAAAAVLHGLVELERRSGHAVFAIAQLKELFEGGFRVQLSEAVELGLIGELVAIVASTAPEEMISAWHSEPHGRFDFSTAGGRLEVKTTTSMPRRHGFRQRQVIDPFQGDVAFCSIVASRVEIGDTVASIVQRLADRVNSTSIARVEDIVVRTCKAPSSLVTRMKVDLEAAKSSLALYDRTEIPAPGLRQGVFDVEWVAVLGEPAGVAKGVLVDLLRTPRAT